MSSVVLFTRCGNFSWVLLVDLFFESILFRRILYLKIFCWVYSTLHDIFDCKLM